MALNKFTMAKKWILTLAFLFYCQKMVSGAPDEKEENAKVSIQCQPPEAGPIVIWLRVQDTGMQFIGSFTSNGMQKMTTTNFTSIFSYDPRKPNVLVLKSFKRDRDSGLYTCGSFNKNAMKFGDATRLTGKNPVQMTTPPTTTTTTDLNTSTSAMLCACETKMNEVKVNALLWCEPVVLGALAGGCGLLLLLLILTICYCNRIRTRRCPHHYKRKPRMTAPAKKHSIAM